MNFDDEVKECEKHREEILSERLREVRAELSILERTDIFADQVEEIDAEVGAEIRELAEKQRDRLCRIRDLLAMVLAEHGMVSVQFDSPEMGGGITILFNDKDWGHPVFNFTHYPKRMPCPVPFRSPHSEKDAKVQKTSLMSNAESSGWAHLAICKQLGRVMVHSPIEAILHPALTIER